MTSHNVRQRIARLQSVLARHDIDALLISDEINVRYASHFAGDSSLLLITRDSATILSDQRYATQLQLECPNIAHAIRPPDQALNDLVAEQVAKLGQVRLGFESASVSVATHREWKKKCEGVTWIETIGIVEGLRIVKDASEIATIRQAIDIAERTYQSIIPKLRPDWTELDIAHEIESTMRVLGAEGVSFAAIVGAGESGALPHYRPRRTHLADTATLLFDFGAKFEGYASDITRTLARENASSEFRHAYAGVLESQLAAIDAIGPGVATKHIDDVARQVLRKHGLAEAFKHGLGHGIGLQIHESPRLSALSNEVLAEDMVITVEPGVYFEGKFGIRIEDDVLVTSSGCEVLTHLPKALVDCCLIL